VTKVRTTSVFTRCTGCVEQSAAVASTTETGVLHYTCQSTQVNAPRLNPSQAGRYSIYLPRRDRRLSWIIIQDSLPLPGGSLVVWLVIHRDGLPCPHTVARPSSNHLIATRRPLGRRPTPLRLRSHHYRA